MYICCVILYPPSWYVHMLCDNSTHPHGMYICCVILYPPSWYVHMLCDNSTHPHGMYICCVILYPPSTVHPVWSFQEVKQLTLDLLELAPAPKSKVDQSAVLYDWKLGDQCKAVWPDNGK